MPQFPAEPAPEIAGSGANVGKVPLGPRALLCPLKSAFGVKTESQGGPGTTPRATASLICPDSRGFAIPSKIDFHAGHPKIGAGVRFAEECLAARQGVHQHPATARFR